MTADSDRSQGLSSRAELRNKITVAIGTASKHTAQAQGTPKKATNRCPCDRCNHDGARGFDVPELLKFAGSIVPEPSTTSPSPFIVV